MIKKFCVVCGSENFSRSKLYCSQKCANKDYYQKNKAKINEDHKRWNKENRDKTNKYLQNWVNNNYEKHLKYQREWARKKKEKMSNE